MSEATSGSHWSASATSPCAPTFRRSPASRASTLVAVADVEEERLAAAPEGVRRTTDVPSVLADPEVDAVVDRHASRRHRRARPRRARRRQVGACGEAARALGRRDGRTCARRPGASERLQIGLTYRHHPAVDRLRELIAAGALGRPLLIQAAHLRRAGEPGAGASRLRAAAAFARADPAGRLRRRARVRPDQLPARRGAGRRRGLEPAHRSGLREGERQRRRPHLRRRHDRAARGRLADAGAAPQPVRRHRPERPRDARASDVPAHGRARGRHDGDARAARRQDRGLLRAPARALRRFGARRHAAGARPRRGDREPRARGADRPRRRRRPPLSRCPHDRLPRAPAGRGGLRRGGVPVGDGRAGRRPLRRVHVRGPASAERRGERIARRLGRTGARPARRLRDGRPARPGRPGGDRALRPRARDARRQAASLAAGVLRPRPRPAARLRGRRRARRPDPLPRRHAAVLHSAPARRARAAASRDADRARPRRPARPLARGDRGRAGRAERPPLHVRDARVRDAGDRRSLPARAPALRHRCRAPARAAAALRRAARAPARRAGPRRRSNGRRSSSRIRAACSPHDRHPLPRADASRRRPARTSSSSTTSGARTVPLRRRRRGPTTPRRSRTWTSRSRSRSPATGLASTPR